MGAPKHDLKLPDGRTMIEAVADAVEEVCDSTIILGPDGILPELPHVHDLREGQGPLGGIEALLESGRDKHYLIVPCDLPRITSTLLQRLVQPTAAKATVFQIADRQQCESLPMRLSCEALSDVKRLLDEGRRAVHHLLDSLSIDAVTLSAAEAGDLTNINAPEDLDALPKIE